MHFTSLLVTHLVLLVLVMDPGRQTPKQTTNSTTSPVKGPVTRSQTKRTKKQPTTTSNSSPSTKRKAANPQLKTQPRRKKYKKSSISPNATLTSSREAHKFATKTCSICFEDKTLNDYPTPDTLPSTCRHDLSICSVCIGTSLAEDIASKPHDLVGCPQCGEAWDRSIIECFATSKAFSQYEEQGIMMLLEAMPNFRRCAAPGCRSGQLHEAGDEQPIMNCGSCGFRTCFHHRVAWHEGKTCEEYDRERNMDAKTKMRVEREEKQLRKTVRSCPGCNVEILKLGGCDHMTCASTSLACCRAQMVVIMGIL